MNRSALLQFCVIGGTTLLSTTGHGMTTSEIVRKEGELRVGLHCGVDLDVGQGECMITLDGDGTELPSHPAGRHIDFTLEPAVEKRLSKARNGAAFALLSNARPGFAGCTTATYDKKDLRVDGATTGDFVCIRTSDGRYAQLRFIRAVPTRGADRVVIAYITWDRPNTAP